MSKIYLLFIIFFLFIKCDSNPGIIESILNSMDLSPSGIIKHLNLQKPIYSKTAAYGHFGQSCGEDGSFSWEKIDLTEILKKNII